MPRTGLPRRCTWVLFLASVVMLAAFAPRVRAQEGAGAPGKARFAPQSTFYAELLGSAVVYSLNYDLRPTQHLAFRAGFAGWGGTDGAIGLFPMTVSGLIGKRQHSFELGGGPVFVFGTGDLNDFDSGVFGTAFVAYRMQPAEGGFFFRAGIGPLFNSEAFLIWPVLSFGVSF